MALTGRKLTDPEKAAICFAVLEGVDDWKQLYYIAARITEKEAANVRYIDTYVSKWKTSEKVKIYLDEVKARLAVRDEDNKRQGAQEERTKQAAESERAPSEGGTKFSGPVDYSDPANRKRLYNSVIARSKDDPRTQLDAAKLFEQIQKDDREAARTQKVVRSYLPIRCNSCPLYQKAKEKTTK